MQQLMCVLKIDIGLVRTITHDYHGQIILEAKLKAKGDYFVA